MKKLIFLVGLVIMSLHAFPQTGGLGGTSSILTPSTPDNSTPTGQGFGGALGGATTNSTTVPFSTTPGTSNSTGTGTGTLEQQRMEDPAFRGGALGGSSLPPTTTPQTTQPPLNPGTQLTPAPTTPATNVPSATGVGTGSPSGF